jgi:trehalose 6-phosphate phosphatase
VMPPEPDAALLERLNGAEGVRLFLDYDGTLAEFAPTPEHVSPDPELVDLLSQLANHPRIRAAIISGRRLDHVRRLVPVAGILLAGTYGIEIQTPQGVRFDRLEYGVVRPTLEKLKPQWSDLIDGREGFFLEDKGWALALHARFAEASETDRVLAAAHRLATDAIEGGPAGTFRMLGGHKFLEIGPRSAHKGRTVEYIFESHPWPGSLPLYLGDDDKDEEAFGVIQAQGGLTIVVTPVPRDTQANYRLQSPQAARYWLRELQAHLSDRPQASSHRQTPEADTG